MINLLKIIFLHSSGRAFTVSLSIGLYLAFTNLQDTNLVTIGLVLFFLNGYKLHRLYQEYIEKLKLFAMLEAMAEELGGDAMQVGSMEELVDKIADEMAEDVVEGLDPESEDSSEAQNDASKTSKGSDE